MSHIALLLYLAACSPQRCTTTLSQTSMLALAHAFSTAEATRAEAHTAVGVKRPAPPATAPPPLAPFHFQPARRLSSPHLPAAFYTTFWNVAPTGKDATKLPVTQQKQDDCEYGPLLTFVGWASGGGTCAAKQWFVEEVGRGKVAHPRDIHAAQVAARRAGGMR